MHYLEKISDVDYRYNKIFDGKIYDNQDHCFHPVSYNSYVRDTSKALAWNRENIVKFLRKNELLYDLTDFNCKAFWFESKLVGNKLLQQMAVDSRFLLK